MQLANITNCIFSALLFLLSLCVSFFFLVWFWSLFQSHCLFLFTATANFPITYWLPKLFNYDFIAFVWPACALTFPAIYIMEGFAKNCRQHRVLTFHQARMKNVYELHHANPVFIVYINNHRDRIITIHTQKEVGNGVKRGGWGTRKWWTRNNNTIKWVCYLGEF